jgi:hypothetical protein
LDDFYNRNGKGKHKNNNTDNSIAEDFASSSLRKILNK